MRRHWLLVAAAAALTPVAAIAGTAPAGISGDYVEVRTCSVYTGACHANGEAVTEGREAILVWHVRQADDAGSSLHGLTVAAVVEGTGNLAWQSTRRKSVLYVDERAAPDQRRALAGLVASRCAAALGDVVAVRSAPIAFARRGLAYSVHIPGVAEVRTTRYACEHCIMPHAVWYDPFVPLRHGLVAQASISRFAGCPDLPVRWLRRDENSSYAGTFSL